MNSRSEKWVKILELKIGDLFLTYGSNTVFQFLDRSKNGLDIHARINDGVDVWFSYNFYVNPITLKQIPVRYTQEDKIRRLPIWQVAVREGFRVIPREYNLLCGLPEGNNYYDKDGVIYVCKNLSPDVDTPLVFEEIYDSRSQKRSKN